MVSTSKQAISSNHVEKGTKLDQWEQSSKMCLQKGGPHLANAAHPNSTKKPSSISFSSLVSRIHLMHGQACRPHMSH